MWRNYGLGEQKTVLEKTKWNSHKYFCKLVSRIAVSFFKEKVFCESFYGPSCLNDPKKNLPIAYIVQLEKINIKLLLTLKVKGYNSTVIDSKRPRIQKNIIDPLIHEGHLIIKISLPILTFFCWFHTFIL